jgi:uncharacterized protein YjlB
MLSPELAVAGARRVTKRNGWVGVWHGELPEEEPQPDAAPEPVVVRRGAGAAVIADAQGPDSRTVGRPW